MLFPVHYLLFGCFLLHNTYAHAGVNCWKGFSFQSENRKMYAYYFSILSIPCPPISCRDIERRNKIHGTEPRQFGKEPATIQFSRPDLVSEERARKKEGGSHSIQIWPAHSEILKTFNITEFVTKQKRRSTLYTDLTGTLWNLKKIFQVLDVNEKVLTN